MGKRHARPVLFAHRSMSGQFHAGRPETVHDGEGSRPRCFHVLTVCEATPSRVAMSSDPTGSQFFGGMAAASHVYRGLTRGDYRGYTYGMTSTQPRKLQSEIVPGDVIMFFGTPHRIDRIDPPTPETLSFFPTCCGFARSADGWGISLDGAPHHFIEVL